jgi:lactate dehydrogenase-like 2-hydroxyacid dehydrogenase
MSKPKVFVMSTLPTAVEERLSRDYDPILNSDDHLVDPGDLATLAAGCDAVICSPADVINADTIQALPDSVKMLPTFSVGFNHIDLDAAKARGLVVTNTPDVLTDATADTTLLCLLGATKRVWESMTMLRRQEWTGWKPTQLMGTGITGKRLGIFGMGRIGRAVAERARAFGMEIHYYDTYTLAPEDAKGAIKHDSAEDLLKVSDVLTLHCNLTPETTKFIDDERIALMPDGAIIVNTARGPVVDDEALIRALKSGKIAGAGLDVFDGEPNVNPGYLECDNAFLLPHLGSATVETRNAMGFRVLDNMDAFFAGQEPPHRVA